MRGLAYAAVEGRYNIRHVRLWAAGTQHPGTLITNALPGQLQVRHGSCCEKKSGLEKGLKLGSKPPSVC